MRKITLLFTCNLLSVHIYAQLHSHFTASGGIIVPAINVGEAYHGVLLGWRQCQQYMTSSYNWGQLDSKIQNIQNNLSGVTPWITIQCTNPITANDTIAGTCAYNYDHSNGNIDNDASWFPEDSVKWKLFLDALIERYDGDGFQDMPGLLTPVTRWHIEQEWERVWCSQYTDTSLAKAQEFVLYEKMTYNEIKSKQPNSQISFAGLTNHRTSAFYDGYYNQPTYCLSNCITDTNLTPSQFIVLYPNFLEKRRNILYLMRNALYDELDVHQYGEWNHIAGVVKWLKDSASLGNKPVAFFEGGGPLCKTCENVYHSANDTDGILPPPLIRDNASYIVYYFITGLANGVAHLNWHVTPEYTNWGNTWGDLDLLSKNYVAKPSLYTYRFLANTIFSNANADTVVRITETNQDLYHYRINPLGMDVIWSTNTTDSITSSGTGQLYQWNIPTTCDSIYPTYCDSVVQQSSVNVSSSYTIHLSNGVPVFYSWNNVLGVEENITSASNIKIYPNPFSSSTTLRTNNFVHNATLTVYNLYGQQVKQIKNISGQTITLQRDNLPSGLYLIRLTQDNKVITADKLVITD